MDGGASSVPDACPAAAFSPANAWPPAEEAGAQGAAPTVHPPPPIEIAQPAKRARLSVDPTEPEPEEEVDDLTPPLTAPGPVASTNLEAPPAPISIAVAVAPEAVVMSVPPPVPFVPRPAAHGVHPRLQMVRTFEPHELRDKTKWNDKFWRAHREGFTVARVPLVAEVVGNVRELGQHLARYELMLIAVIDPPISSGVATDLDGAAAASESESVGAAVEYCRARLAVAQELGAFAAEVTIAGAWWPKQDRVTAVQAVSAVGQQLGVLVLHSTSRRGLLSSPWVARDVLAQVPTARVSVNLADWYKAAGRVFDPEGADGVWWPKVLELVADRATALDIGFDQSLQYAHPGDPAAENDLLKVTKSWELIVACMGQTVLPEDDAPAVYVGITHNQPTAIPRSKVAVVSPTEVRVWLEHYLKAIFRKVYPHGQFWVSSREIKLYLPPQPKPPPTPVQEKKKKEPKPKEVVEEDPPWFEKLEQLIETGEPGDVVVEAAGPLRRIVYFAVDNETPRDCADKLVPYLPGGDQKATLKRLMDSNKVYHKGLRQKAKLRPKTVIVLPLADGEVPRDPTAAPATAATANEPAAAGGPPPEDGNGHASEVATPAEAAGLTAATDVAQTAADANADGVVELTIAMGVEVEASADMEVEVSVEESAAT